MRSERMEYELRFWCFIMICWFVSKFSAEWELLGAEDSAEGRAHKV